MTSARERLRRSVGGFVASAGAGFARPATRMLLLSDGREYTSEQQFAPIWRHRNRLRRDLGLAIDWGPLDGQDDAGWHGLSGYDLIGLKLSFRRSASEAMDIVRRVRETLGQGSATRLVYFDGDDDSAVLWPELVELTDLYVKKHLFTDPADYRRAFIGKSNLTDHAARVAGRSFADDIIPIGQPEPVLTPAKLYLGWNIALDDKIARLPTVAPTTPRSIDICGRVHVSPDSWLGDLRAPAIAALESLAGRWRVAVPRARVSQAAYDAELRAARICVSPFGYGELCWRDFEAIQAGCLLVKPDVGHIRTAPDLFEAGVTYAPVRWDYADLEGVCARYLSDEGARIAIVEEGQRRLRESLGPGWFVERMRVLLAALEKAADEIAKE
ncbi:MAG: glycosyltransferase family 1 protein [Rhizorhabdus sp.]|uniref:glycosyltransferase n=1 Tax=Rhizorhabdus sp. TaxID=1968843 RepID=UPI001B509EE3|nr:glycosyltransferase [Rhizorhabdus sp.]MBP8233269.1 glycosyltransferase family 1 protein [Rhizorhabdus sp.]